MKLKSLVIKNAPSNEQFVLDFVESTIDVDVKSLQYSPISKGTALVSFDEYIDFEDAKSLLKENENLLDDRKNFLEVLDPDKCDNMIVVNDLDEKLLSQNFLKLYIESTFADGNEVVSDCKVIPESHLTILTFSDPNVVDLVLNSEDHKPLPSVNYQIKIGPVYKNFHLTMIEQLNLQRKPSEEIFCFKTSKDNQSFDDSNQENSDFDAPLTDSQNAKNFELVEEEKNMNLSMTYWKLLKDKLNSLPCHVEYVTEDQILKICSKDPENIKSNILDLVLSVKKCALELNKEEIQYFNTEKVKSLMNIFFSTELKHSNFVVDKDKLSVFSCENSEKCLQKVKERFLFTSSVQLPKATTQSKIQECFKYCKKYLVILSQDETHFTLKGWKEDVRRASGDLDKMIDESRYVIRTFSLTGIDAVFVIKNMSNSIQDLFQNAEIVEKDFKSDVVLKYRCERTHLNKLEENLKRFTKSIKKDEVDMKEYRKEDLSLIRYYLRIDTDTLNDFQSKNKCCVVVEGNENTVFLAKSTRKAQISKRFNTTPHVKKSETLSALFNQKKKRGISIGSSCKLQIKPFGNIAREKTDLLVCGVHESLNLMKTKVSKAFSKMDRTLQSEISTSNFSPNLVWMNQRQLPKTRCKAVAFIILTPWQQGVSDQNLSAAVTEILDTANTMSLTSVSFPPLGYGKAFRFPARAVAQTIFNAIDSFIKANSGKVQIKLINVLAPDYNLFSKMNKVVDNVFKDSESSNSTGHDDSNNCSDNNDDDDYGGGNDDEDEEEKGAKALGTSSDEDDVDGELQMEVLKISDKPLHITLVHTGDNDLVSEFKVWVKKKWLSVEFFKTDRLSSWSPTVWKHVLQTAKSLGVLVTKEDSTSKGISCEMKGKHEEVLKMKSEIYEYMDSLSPGVESDLKFPSYWQRKDKDRKGANKNLLVDVGNKTSNAIKYLFTATWDQNKFGLGNDASNMHQSSGIRVIKIQRLENPSLFFKYSARRKAIFTDFESTNWTCRDISELRNSSGPVQTMSHLHDSMKRELNNEVNEVYLFHGTKPNLIDSIMQQGMDNRLTNKKAMLGLGVYLAESSTKSDQYSDSSAERLPNETNLTMILARAVLGNVFVCKENHESLNPKSPKLKRPPCTACYKDTCTCGKPLFHSVMADGKWIFREFVVYENSQCYPEYFITYQRTN